MRVLIISFAFPPYHVIGSTRVGKTAKYLHRFGNEVRVVAGLEPGYPPTAVVEIPADHVSYSPWTDVDAPYQSMLQVLHAVRRTVRRGAKPDETSAWLASASARLHNNENGARPKRAFSERVRRLYHDLVHFPDGNIGWYRAGLRDARRVASEFNPDVIFASASPTTGLLVARQLSREIGVPWVAELRDLWADNHYRDTSEIRHRADQWIERRVLRDASALVTVSEPLAATLRSKYDVPVTVVLNGFDAEDIQSGDSTAREPGLEVLHAGTMLTQRDPSTLFEAIKLMGESGKEVRLKFLGATSADAQSYLRSLASKRGVSDQLEFVPAVPHAESMRMQQQTDVLLLLMWNNPRERGVFTGKLFEYVGARRPILSVGITDGVAAELIRERKFGFVSDNAQTIAAQLTRWLEEKRANGRLAAPTSESVHEFTREAQTRRLEQVLQQAIVRSTKQTAGA